MSQSTHARTSRVQTRRRTAHSDRSPSPEPRNLHVPHKALTEARIAARVLGPLLVRDTIDVYGVACLCRRRFVLAWHQLDRRTTLRPTPTPYDLLFAPLLADGTDGLLIVHARANGNPHPTRRDAVLTMRLALVADARDVPFIDHLIVGEREEHYFSFCEYGLANTTNSYLKRSLGHHAT